MNQLDNVIVRPLAEADVATLKANEPRPDLGMVDDYVALHESGEVILAVAEHAGEVVGMGVLDLRETDHLPEVRSLWVFPRHRRIGAGKALSTWLEDKAREKGFREAFLAVDPNNVKAIPLFIELGYSATGTHRFVENPDSNEVIDPNDVSNYLAIYRKSLTMN